LIGVLINHIYRSMFLTGDQGLKNTDSILKIIFVFSTIYSFILFKEYLTIYLLTLFIILGLIDKGVKWFYSVSILSLIPSTWYSLVAYIFSITGISEYVSLIRILWIFIRTYTFTYMIIFYVSIINPLNIYNLLLKIKLSRYSIIPVMTWRIIPYSLNNMIDSLAIGQLKKEKTTQRLAPAIASMIETGELVKESSYYKIYTKPQIEIPIKKSIKHNLILIITTITTITLTLI